MKKKTLLTLFTLGGLLGVSSMLLAGPKFTEAKALNETVGSFTVIAGSDYTANATTLSTTTGSFVAKAETGDEFHFSTKMLQSSGQNDAFGFVLNGNYTDGHLSGDVVRLWLNGSMWWMEHGTIVNDVYDYIHHSPCDFDTSWTGQLDLYVYNGVVALRMDQWNIGGFELINTEGDTFIYSSGVSFSVQNPTISVLTSKIGNYLFRGQWGGWNHHGYTYCFSAGSNHSFTMTLPDSLDTSTVTKLILSRGTIERTGGQEADVVVNGTPAGSFSNHASNSQRYTDYDLELPLSLISSTKTLNIVINVNGSELVAHNYKLMYETAEGRFAADLLVFHSSVSETAHNYSTSALGWNGDQYLFIDINANTYSTCYYWAGVKPGKATLLMNNFDRWEAPQVSYVFETNEAKAINFLNYMDLHGASAWSFRNEIWLDFGSGAAYYGAGTWNANAEAASGTYWLDFFFGDMDTSGGNGERKFTLSNTFSVTVNNLGIVKAFAERMLNTTESFASKSESEKATAWSALETEYNGFSADQKTLFKTSDDSQIEAARARYSCIVSRNYSGLNDFVFETVPQPSRLTMMTGVTTPLIIAMPIIIASLALAFVLMRKYKKEY